MREDVFSDFAVTMFAQFVDEIAESFPRNV